MCWRERIETDAKATNDNHGDVQNFDGVDSLTLSFTIDFVFAKHVIKDSNTTLFPGSPNAYHIVTNSCENGPLEGFQLPFSQCLEYIQTYLVLHIPSFMYAFQISVG